MIQEVICKGLKKSILIIANCTDDKFLGSGYVIHHFTQELKKYFAVTYYDVRQYEWLPQFTGRAMMLRFPLGKWWLIFKLLVFRKQEFDIIEFWGGDSFLAMWFVKFFFKKTLLVHHSNGLESKYTPIMDALEEKRNWYHFNYTYFFNKTVTIPNGIVVSTEEDVAWVAQNLPQQKNIVAIPPCLEEKEWLQQVIDFNAKKNIILYVGTWLTKKGVDIIITDMPALLKQFPHYRLRLIGVGDTQKIINNFPSEVHAQIEVIPFIKDKAVLRANYAEAKILVLPSIAESFGMVTLEAMSGGCAIVATKMALAAELTEGEQVVFIKNQEPGALQKALGKLLVNDPLIQSMGQSNYHKAQTYQWASVGKIKAQQYTNWLIHYKAHS